LGEEVHLRFWVVVFECVVVETHHPASLDNFVDSINGVCLQGFFSFL
jgi:hypothetical protein